MKSRMIMVVCFILAVSCFSGIAAQNDSALRSQVESLYSRKDAAQQAKDFEAFMSLHANDYQVIPDGINRAAFQDIVRKNFAENEQIRKQHAILAIDRSGDMIKVINYQLREGKSREGDWKILSDDTKIDFLVWENGSLKFSRTATFDKARRDSVAGKTYTDKASGFSFAVPDNWDIIPSVHPTMQGYVIALAPDRTSLTLFGYVKIAGISAQAGIEGDEALTEKLSKEGTYKLVKSGPITISGHDGFMTESKFLIANSSERHRLRVYFNANGALYVLCFDAMPPTQWDAVKDSFQSILNSIKVTP